MDNDNSQRSFFPSRFEVFQKANPERFARGQKGALAGKGGRSSSTPKAPPKPKVFNCDTCGLWGKTSGQLCTQIKRTGAGNKKILFVGLAPSGEDVRLGLPLSGTAGQLLKRHCNMVGLDLDNDCVRTNVVGCHPGKSSYGADKVPAPEQCRACQKHLDADIAAIQPDLIVCMGDQAINAVLEKPKGCKFQGRFTANMMHGIVVPSHKYNCWVASTFHPSFFLKRKHRDDVPDDENLFVFDLAVALGYLGRPLPQPLTKEGNIMLTNVEEIVILLGII